MSRYIDADALIKDIENCSYETWSKDVNRTWWAQAVKVKDNIKQCINRQPTADVVEIPEGGIGNLSDGYHTFNELYHHRAILFSVICNSMPDKAWKSKLHDTGDMYDGMFIVGIETPEGQATYHYDIEPYWDMFKVKELEKAPKWDGHTPQVAIDRISKLSADVEEVRHGGWVRKEHIINEYGDVETRFVCSCCDEKYKRGEYTPKRFIEAHKFCSNCGAKMDGEKQSG